MRFSAVTPDGSSALGPVQREPAPWRTCAPRRALAHAVRNLDAAVAEGGARAEVASRDVTGTAQASDQAAHAAGRPARSGPQVDLRVSSVVGVVLPEWGLTETQREARPWGLAPEFLRAHKKLTDPVHGDIYLTVLETAVLDSAPMQRLRRVRQLGTTQLVYPGATHTRFSHVLGALRAAQDLVDVVLAQGLGPAPVDDLFHEWRSNDDEQTYDCKVGEATVLARLGGLLHDLGHVPFGHTLEEDLGILTPHDENEERYEYLWDRVVHDLKARSDIAPGGIILPDELVKQLRALILSKAESTKSIEQKYPFVADIVGNTICADLIDYLRRDHLYTGLPAAFGHKFLDGFYVTRSDHPFQRRRMVIRISRAGQPRADVVSELFKYLRYRYELSERALVHHAKLAADVMIGKAIDMWHAALEAESDAVAARTAIESQVLRRGDDGLLEHLIDVAEQRPSESRWGGIADIARQLQGRRLFKGIGVYTRRAMAPDLYARYGDAKQRERVERDAAHYAGADHGWMVALWVPNPEMRLKAAEVFVDDGNTTELVHLGAWDREHVSRGMEIVESHYRLWAVRVYVDSRLSDEQRAVVLGRLQTQLGISGWGGGDRSLAEIAADRVCTERQLPNSERATLVKIADQLLATHPTFEALIQALRESRTPTEVAGLMAWRRRGRITIKHVDLESTIAAASNHIATVGGADFDVTVEENVIRLNLALFLRDLDDRAFIVPDGRERVTAFISESPGDFEDRVWNQLPKSAPARREAPDADQSNEAKLAVESAVRDFVKHAPDSRLFK